MYIIEHPIIIFLFFTFPFFGWILYKSFNDKVIRIIVVIALILLIPIITGYSYIIENLYAFLFYVILSCTYCLTIKSGRTLYKNIVKPTLFSFAFFGFLGFEGAFLGTVSIQQEWNVKDYKIQYIKDQGFSGRPLMRYELYKYASIPGFIKHVESKIDTDTIINCNVKFKYENFNFDKCVF